jgi:hypothetical protein
VFKILFSSSMNMVLTIHFGDFVGAETVAAAKVVLADSRFTGKQKVLQDLRRVTSATLHDTDRAFVLQSSKVTKRFMDSKIALLYEAGNPVNQIHDERRARFSKAAAQPNKLHTTSFSDAAEWLGVDEQDLNTFIEQNFDPSE